MNIQKIIRELEQHLDELEKTSGRNLNRYYIELCLEEFEHDSIRRIIKDTLDKFIDNSTRESWLYVVELTIQPMIQRIRRRYVDPDDYDDYQRNLLDEELLQDLEELWATLSVDHRVFMSEEQWRIADALDSLRGIPDFSKSKLDNND